MKSEKFIMINKNNQEEQQQTRPVVKVEMLTDPTLEEKKQLKKRH